MALSKKKKITMALCIALAAVLGAGGTYSYLTTQTDTLRNNISFSYSNISAMLTENRWDGVVSYEYDDDNNIYPIYGYDDSGKPIYGYTDGDRTRPVKDRASFDPATSLRPATDEHNNPIAYGIDASKVMIPGQTAAKNPQITNTTENTDEWAAIKMTFVYSSGANKGKPISAIDMAAINDIIEIDYDVNSDGAWYRVGNGASAEDVSQVFYYKNKIASQGVTSPLFTSVRIKEWASQEQVAAVKNLSFTIYLEGLVYEYAVADTFDDFLQWGSVDGNVQFAHTPTSDRAVDIDIYNGIIAADPVV